jgi:hypothetical protein
VSVLDDKLKGVGGCVCLIKNKELFRNSQNHSGGPAQHARRPARTMAVLEEVDEEESLIIKAQQEQLQLARDRKQWLAIFSNAYNESDITALRYTVTEYVTGCQAAVFLADDKRACLAPQQRPSYPPRDCGRWLRRVRRPCSGAECLNVSVACLCALARSHTVRRRPINMGGSRVLSARRPLGSLPSIKTQDARERTGAPHVHLVWGPLADPTEGARGPFLKKPLEGSALQHV